MKLDAVAISSKEMSKSVAFYTILGFTFPEKQESGDHVEAITKEGEVRLMIDTEKMLTRVLGQAPIPSNHSGFALKYENAAAVDAVVAKLEAAGYTIVKQPWDAFWGQRYAIVEDPAGYKVDLFAQL